jgi:hypothetical protein
VEPFLLILEGWWWVAPAAAGAGTAAYAGLTMKSRRARRLELDAARHEEATAYRDTLGDLTLSLCGSLTGALIVTLVASRRRSGRRTSPSP